MGKSRALLIKGSPPSSDFLPISRRAFLAAAASTPIVASAALSEDSDYSEIDLSFELSEDGEKLTITPIRQRVLRNEDGEALDQGASQTFGKSWELQRTKFGPDAKFYLRRRTEGPGVLLGYELVVWNSAFGRIRNRPLSFRFLQFHVPTPGLKSPDKVRRRFRVAIDTSIWSSSRAALAPLPMSLLAEPAVADPTSPERYVLFESFASGAAKLAQTIWAGSISQTFRLMFNGLAAFPPAQREAIVTLKFGSDLHWSVEVPKGSNAGIWALHRGIVGKTIEVWLERPEGQTDTEKLSLRAKIGKVSVDRLAMGDRKQLVAGLSLDQPRYLTVALRAGLTGDTEIHGDPAEEGKGLPYLAEGELGFGSGKLTVGEGPQLTAGPFKLRRMRLHAKSVTSATMLATEPRHPKRTLVLDGVGERKDGKDQSLTPRTVETPIGRISFAVRDDYPRVSGTEDGAAPSDQAANAEGTAESFAPFAPRRGWPVQAVFTRGAASGPGEPVCQWFEAQGLLHRLETALPEAQYSRLDFAPSDLAIVYAPGKGEIEPVGSVLRLGDVGDGVRARIDLSRAKLRASRTDALLALTFRFADLVLTYRGKTLELLGINRQCLQTGAGVAFADAESARLTSGRSAAALRSRPDARPVLVVEFPPQHLFEEALEIPNDPEPPDVKVEGTFTVNSVSGSLAEDSKGKLDLNDRAAVVRVLQMLETPARKKQFRKDLYSIKISAAKRQGYQSQPSKEISEFRDFGEKLEKRLKLFEKLNRIPPDQMVYIGPYAMDPDVMAVARLLAREEAQQKVSEGFNAMLAALQYQATTLAEPTTQAEGLAREALFESALPTYAAFRSFYREAMLESYAQRAPRHLVKIAPPPNSLDVGEVEFFFPALEPGLIPDWLEPDPARKRYLAARAMWAQKEFLKALKTPREARGKTEGRISGPSRLAFRLKCRDGLVAARLDAPGLDRDPDLDGISDVDPQDVARPGLSRERFMFSLDALTRFADMELSVVARAERVFVPDNAGRIDSGSRRLINEQVGAMLDHLGFRSGEFLTSAERLADIQASLVAPGPFETAIELPARLILSPHQQATFLTPPHVPEGVFDLPTPENFRPSVPLWTADLMLGRDDPGLRAVYSPDLAPDFMWQRLQRLSGVRAQAAGPGGADRMVRLPGASAPLRGPWAPWTIGREEANSGTARPTDLQGLLDPPLDAGVSPNDEAFCKALLDYQSNPPDGKGVPALIKYLCHRLGLQTADNRRLRFPIDAYARHELVLLSSAWGLPVVARRLLTGGLEGTSQIEPDAQDLPIDLEPGSVLYKPQPLAVSELGLSSLGGSLRHDTTFEPPAAARHLTGDPLFDALSIEKWQQWTVLGRDILTEIVYKGFLFPFGHRASLVQHTERTFFHDEADRKRPIRAYLNQRLFLRVGKPVKDFPAVGQPVGGRMFPALSVKIVTTKSPDLVDPFADYPTGQTTNVDVRPGGRVHLPGSVPGIAFWPRTVRSDLGNVRFQVLIDGVRTDLPLLFVDNVLANDKMGMKELAAYYNDLKSAATYTDTGSEFLSTIALPGTKLRYADERESGSASIETVAWHLTVCGQKQVTPQESPPSNPAEPSMKLDNSDFTFGPILNGADQPPFYPVVNRAWVRLAQTERLLGATLDPVMARFDGRYLRDGLPQVTADAGTDEMEVYLNLIEAKRQDTGQKGDRLGGLMRVADFPVGLSRARGVVTHKHVQKDAEKPVDGTADLAGVTHWPMASKKFDVKTNPAPVTSEATTGSAPAVIADPEEVRARAQEALGEAKLLGLITFADIIEFVEASGLGSSVAGALPQINEFYRYGADAVNLDQLVETLRTEVVLPLSRIVGEVADAWRKVEAKVTQEQQAALGQVGASDKLSPITLKEVYPDLDAGLAALDGALRRAAEMTDPLAFSLSLGAVHEAGRRFVDALRRTAANPVERFHAAFRGRIETAIGFLKEFEEGLVEGLIGQVEQKVDAFYKAKVDKIVELLVPNIPTVTFTPFGNGLTIGLKDAEINQLNEAFKALEWSNKDLRALAKAAVTGLIDQLKKHVGTNQSIDETFRGLFAKTALSVGLTDLGGTKPSESDTVAAFLARYSKAKVDRAQAEVRKVGNAVLDRFADELAGIAAALTADATQWVVERFWDELVVLADAIEAVEVLKEQIDARNVAGSANSAVKLLEVFTGPLGINLDTICATVLKPLGAVIPIVRLGDWAVVPGAVATKRIEDTVTVDDVTDDGPVSLSIPTMALQLHLLSKEALKSVQQTVVPKIDVAAQAMTQSTDLPADAATKARDLIKAARDVEKDLRGISDASFAMAKTLVNDSLEARDLDRRLASFTAKNFDSCPDRESLSEFRAIDSDLRELVRRRKVVLGELKGQGEKIVASLESLVNNPAVQLAGVGLTAQTVVVTIFGATATGAAVDAVRDWAETQIDWVRTTEKQIASRAILLIGQLLKTARTAASQLQDGMAPLLEIYQDAIAPYVTISVLRENLQSIADFASGLDGLLARDSKFVLLADSAQKAVSPDFDGAAVAPTFADLRDWAAGAGNNFPVLRFLKPEFGPGVTTLAQLAEIDELVRTELDKVAALGRRALRRATVRAWEAVRGAVQSVLNESIGGKTIPDLYRSALDGREALAKQVNTEKLQYVMQKLYVPADDVRKAVVIVDQDAKDAVEANRDDRLFYDAKALAALSTTPATATPEAEIAFLRAFVSEWGSATSTPQQLIEQIGSLLQDLIKGDILQLLDLTAIRDQVEAQLKSLVPVEQELRFGFGITLTDNVKEATLGVFRPINNARLELNSVTKINLLPLGGDPVTFAAEGTLGPFEIKLVGDAFDGLTLRFGGARFTAESGRDSRFELDYIGHKVGPLLSFIEKLQAILSPQPGSGPYLTPTLAPLGIEAGYKLNVGVFSLGAMSFFNVSLNAAVVLPFEDGDARFRASLSRRDSPFTISYLPWGGSGFFAIEANSKGIIGFEMSLEFGGAAAFAFGPLTGTGRLMAGCYIRVFKNSVGKRITEISATFYVGGEAKIWIFTFGASLHVRLGQVDGNMTGEAVFTYSFSIGIKDFEFSVRIVKKENKGYSGSGGNGDVRGKLEGGLLRFADLVPGPVPKTDEGRRARTDAEPHIKTTTVCQAENWVKYRQYFSANVILPEDCFA